MTDPPRRTSSEELLSRYVRAASASASADNIGQMVALRAVGATLQQPQPPTGLTAAPADQSVTLNWTASQGATSYEVYRSPIQGGPYPEGNLIGIATTETTYNDVGLANGTRYYYVVRAVNESGRSPNSAEVNAMPTAPCGTISLSPSTLPVGKVGSNYNVPLTAVGGPSGPYSFSLISGTLPPELSLTTNGVLSGIPKKNTGGKTFRFTIRASSHGCSGSSEYSLTISR